MFLLDADATHLMNVGESQQHLVDAVLLEGVHPLLDGGCKQVLSPRDV